MKINDLQIKYLKNESRCTKDEIKSLIAGDTDIEVVLDPDDLIIFDLYSRQESFTFYSDGSHSWLKVSNVLLDALGIRDNISSYSYGKGSNSYLEEDCDAGIFTSSLKELEIPFSIEEEEDNLNIRSFSRYK